MPISISKLPEVTNVKDNSFMLITQDGTTKRTMCDQFVTEEEARLDEFSPTVITSKSMSKTGEGDNVDYSSSVYDAPMKDVILKGKTMVNCIQEPSSQDVVLPYEFEDGQYVTINDTKESGALGVELKGQTLVNLIEGIYTIGTDAVFKDGYITLSQKSVEYLACYISFQYALSENKKYLLIMDVKENTLNDVFRTTTNSCIASGEVIVPNGVTGIIKHIMQVGGDNLERITLRTNNGDFSGSITFKPMLIEYQQGMENWDIPYFEGMASCKMPILKTVGKNLFNLPLVQGSQTYGTIGGKPTHEIYSHRVTNEPNKYIKVEPNTQITFSVINNDVRFSIAELDKHGNRLGDTGWLDTVSQKTITTKSSTHYIGFNFKKVGNTNITVEEVINSNPMLEYSNTSTSYEPYKSSILSTNEDLELRGLGDVQDTLDLNTGKLTSYYGERIITEDDSFSTTLLDGKCTCIVGNMTDKISSYASDNFLADKVPHGAPANTDFGIYQNLGNFVIYETGDDLEAFKSKVIGTKIYYRLAEPVNKAVDLKVVDQNGNVIPTLKSWNTTTHIYSEIPENSLYPALSHSNPTYPVILKPSTKYSIVANSYSNDHTNSAINFNLGGATASTTVGSRVTTITTPSTLSNELLTMSGRGNKLNNVMVIEGDVAGDEPYFEGICDCKTPILSNVGKNLFDVDYFVKKVNNPNVCYKNEEGSLVIKGSYHSVKINVPYSTTITYLQTSTNTANNGASIFEAQHPDGTCTHIGVGVNTTLERKTLSIKKPIIAIGFNNWAGGENILKDIMLVKTESSTAYEPYKSNTTTFDQKDGKTIVLRSLPNGVCDTLNIETGEYVQRIGEVVKNNSTGFSLSTGGWENKTKVCTFEHFKPEGMKVQNANDKPTLNCDRVSSNTFSTQWGNSEGIESITQHSGGNIVLSIARDKLLTQDVDGLNTYLQSNPLTIQYELATPIVSTIDVQGFPYAYTNGHVQLSSGHTEQSLTPKVEYNIATNRGGQITQNTKSLIRQGKLLDDIEDKINQIIEATINDSIMLMKLRNK